KTPVRGPDDRLIPRILAHRPPLIRPHHASLQPATPASKPCSGSQPPAPAVPHAPVLHMHPPRHGYPPAAQGASHRVCAAPKQVSDRVNAMYNALFWSVSGHQDPVTVNTGVGVLQPLLAWNGPMSHFSSS